MSEPLFDPKTRDLAEKIYCDLVSSAVDVKAASVAITTDPANLATISFKLAAAFHAVEDKLNAANLPKNQDFKVGADDITAWSR